MPVLAEQVAGSVLAYYPTWPRLRWQNAASRQVEEPWVPTGLCELSSSDLRRRSASLEIAVQRRVSGGTAVWPPPMDLASSDLRCSMLEYVKATITEEGPA